MLNGDELTVKSMRDAWSMTKQRCLNPRQRDYRRYGGRGIGICERWLVFENFLSDMGLRPHGMTLERLDNDKGYCPENCVWATRSTQTRNRDATLKLTYLGVTKSLVEWSISTGIPYHTLKARHTRLGYSDEECLEKPVKCGGRPAGRPPLARRPPSFEGPRGGFHCMNTRLSLRDVLYCRKRWSEGSTFSALARDFQVTTTTMSKACQGLGAYSGA